MLPNLPTQTPEESPAGPESSPQTAPLRTQVHRSKLLLVLGGTAVLLILAGSAFAYYYFFLQKPLPNVNVNTTLQDMVLVGETFPVEITYSNNSDQPLRNAALDVAFPEGISLAAGDPSQRFSEFLLGDVAPGGYGKQDFNLIVTDGAQSVKKLDINLRYSVTNDTGSQFRSESYADVNVGDPAVTVNLATPQGIMTGQDFTITAAYQNNSTETMSGAKLTFTLPQGLEIKEGSTTPTLAPFENGVWTLGDLQPSATGSITMTASFTGDAGFVSLPAAVSVQSGGQTYSVWSATPQITVAQAPLALSIQVNGANQYVARPGDQLTYRLTYKNNSPVALSDVQLSAQISGSMLDLTRLQTQGSFNSVTNTLSWAQANTPALANVDSGAQGYVEFSVPLKPAFAIRRLADKNFSVKLSATIQSATVAPGVQATETISSASAETRIAGDIALAVLAYYHEPTAGIRNTGPYPPRVNQPTRFTIHWRLVNSATDMTGIHITAKLPPGVSFTGNVRSTVASSSPVYNSQLGTVSWDIPLIAATQGVLGAPAEAIFQIEVTPAVNQAGNVIQLLSDTVLNATDAWTGEGVSKDVQGKDSGLPDDPSAAGSGGIVQP